MAHQAFVHFYQVKGLSRIRSRVALFASKVGVNPGTVQIKDLGYRWKCLMAPLSVIDYIVVHELGHLRYRDHSDAF